MPKDVINYLMVKNMYDGWISLHRELSCKDLWLSEPFSRGQAWVDLLMLAQYKKGHIRTSKGVRIDLDRGQVGMSEMTMAKRWKWSKGKVRRFLSELENDQRIVQHKDNVKSIITICNYSDFQTNDTTNEPQTEQPTDNQRTTNGQPTDTNNKDNKDNKDNKGNNKNISGSRLSVDWTPPQEFVNYCEVNYPAVDAKEALDQFKDHWIAKAGKDGVKKDWLATWRNWLRNGYNLPMKADKKSGFGTRKKWTGGV